MKRKTATHNSHNNHEETKSGGGKKDHPGGVHLFFFNRPGNDCRRGLGARNRGLCSRHGGVCMCVYVCFYGHATTNREALVFSHACSKVVFGRFSVNWRKAYILSRPVVGCDNHAFLEQQLEHTFITCLQNPAGDMLEEQQRNTH